jgi:hypothetical protein
MCLSFFKCMSYIYIYIYIYILSMRLLFCEVVPARLMKRGCYSLVSKHYSLQVTKVVLNK